MKASIGRAWLLQTVAALVLALTVGPLAAAPALAQPFSISPDEERIAELVNQERAKVGAQPLRVSVELMRSAELKANDMKQRNYFSHYSPEGTSPFDLMRQAGANFTAAGENIAEGPTIDEIFKGWMNSAGHRQNILNTTYTHIGVGVVGGAGNYWAVQHFAKLTTVTKDYLPTPGKTQPAPQPAKPPAGTPPVKLPAEPPAKTSGPSPTPTTPAPKKSTRAYVVRPGDTLWLIAKRTGVPYQRLVRLNFLDNPNYIEPGQVIRLR